MEINFNLNWIGIDFNIYSFIQRQAIYIYFIVREDGDISISQNLSDCLKSHQILQTDIG